MTRDEVRTLLAYAAAGTRDWAPGTVDVDVWTDLLGDLPYDDANAALREHAKASRYRPTPAEIRDGVKRIRADRLARAVDQVPDADPDDPSEYARALRENRMRTADGLTPRQMPALDRVFPELPPADPRPELAPRNAPSLTGLPPVDEERMAQARAELDAAFPRIQLESEPDDTPADSSRPLAQARAEIAARQPVPVPAEQADA